MSGDHFTGGTLPHQPERFLEKDLYSQVERNVVYACTDVLLRDSSTGKIFLANRQTEPQVGPWLVGGRNMYGESIADNAGEQVANDLHLQIDPQRFHHIATYSTEFPVAGPGRTDHGRHTMNAVMLADLSPEEVSLLNQRVSEHQLRDEYSSGAWYEPEEVARPDSDFPYAMKQLVRDLNDYDRNQSAMRDEAKIANAAYDEIHEQDRLEKLAEERVRDISLAFGLTHEEAQQLEDSGDINATLAMMWATKASEQMAGGQTELSKVLHEVINDASIGDVQILRRLTESGITPPKITSENGPTLRGILKTAETTIRFNQLQGGKLFDRIKSLQGLVS